MAGAYSSQHEFARRAARTLSHASSAPGGFGAGSFGLRRNAGETWREVRPHVQPFQASPKQMRATCVADLMCTTAAPTLKERQQMMHELPPAGYSLNLKNNLMFTTYQGKTKFNPGGTVCTYDAKDALPSVPQVKPKLPVFRAHSVPAMPDRLPPEALRLGGAAQIPKRIHETYHGTVLGGKRLVPDNPSMNSNVDTIIWGRDIDMTWKRGNWLDADMFDHSAGMPRGSAPNFVPPVCERTFGEEVGDSTTGYPMGGSSVARHGFA